MKLCHKINRLYELWINGELKNIAQIEHSKHRSLYDFVETHPYLSLRKYIFTGTSRSFGI